MVKHTFTTSVALIGLLAAGTMAAESNPSNVTGFVRYDLSVATGNGLNIVALPFSQAENANPVASVFDVEAQIGANFVQGLKLNNDNDPKNFTNFVSGDPQSGSTDFTLTQGANFIIITSGTDQFVAAGGVNESTSPISFNLTIDGTGNALNAVSTVPYSDLANGSNYASIFDVGQAIGANFSQGLFHDNFSKAFSNFVAGDPQGSATDFGVSVGTPYYVLVSANDVLSGPTSGNSNVNVFSAQKVSTQVKTTVAKKTPVYKKSTDVKSKTSAKAQKENLKKTRYNKQ